MATQPSSLNSVKNQEQAAYESYQRFCAQLRQEPLPFTEWIQKTSSLPQSELSKEKSNA